MENIVIGGAWPYANGSLHIRHIAALLPGDVLARYFRAKGNRVFYVSGSDCHGTPITIRAKQENSTPDIISEHYHREFCDVFEEVFKAVRFGNTYYDAKQPWKTRTGNPEECRNTIGNCAYLIANIAILLHPFLPFSSSKVTQWLGVEIKWEEQDIGVRVIPGDISILFSELMVVHKHAGLRIIISQTKKNLIKQLWHLPQGRCHNCLLIC